MPLPDEKEGTPGTDQREGAAQAGGQVAAFALPKGQRLGGSTPCACALLRAVRMSHFAACGAARGVRERTAWGQVARGNATIERCGAAQGRVQERH